MLMSLSYLMSLSVFHGMLTNVFLLIQCGNVWFELYRVASVDLSFFQFNWIFTIVEIRIVIVSFIFFEY